MAESMNTLAEESRIKLATALQQLRFKRDRFQSGTQQYGDVQKQIDPLQRDYDAIVKRNFEDSK